MKLKHRDLLRCRFKNALGRDEFQILYWIDDQNLPHCETVILLSLTDGWAYVVDVDESDRITSDNLSSLCDFDEFEVLEVSECEIKPTKKED